MEAIQQSGSQANNPDYFLGYGIPDYALANSILTVIENENSPMDLVSVYPNPFTNEITIQVGEDNSSLKQIELMDITGKSLMLMNYSANEDNVVLNNISNLSAGFYLLKITLGQGSETRKLLKN